MNNYMQLTLDPYPNANLIANACNITHNLIGKDTLK